MNGSCGIIAPLLGMGEITGIGRNFDALPIKDPVRMMLVLPPDTRLSLWELAAWRSGVRDVGQASGRCVVDSSLANRHG